MPRISIAELLAEKEAGLDLELMAGKTGLDRLVQVPRIQKPAPALPAVSALISWSESR